MIVNASDETTIENRYGFELRPVDIDFFLFILLDKNGFYVFLLAMLGLK